MNHNRSICLIILVLFLSGCSTRRNTWLSRGYQNLTARYNVLFNGLQSFEEGRDNMRESISDDFTAILPLFPYSNGSGASVPASQMQRAIEKGQKLIKEHSISVKPNRKPKRGQTTYETFYNQREFNRWVDDAWMLIGKAHVYQRAWPEAIYAFETVLRDFPEQSSRFEALLWLARVYVESGQMNNARLALNRYESEGNAPIRFYGDFMATYARFWLESNNYSKALPYCTAAAENAGSRWEKVRRTFILGQVCEQLGLNHQSEEAFTKVIHLNPDYEMSFHARVKAALLAGGRENPGLVRQKLGKYLRQNKNREYRDQLYFAMAQTWFWEEDTLQALTQLKLAAGYNEGNQILKGKIYLKMADVYMETREYVAAHAYYDSSLVMLSEDDYRLSEVSDLVQKLAPLSTQLQVIEHEDSVRRIAQMPSAEREAFLENLVAMYQQEEEEGAFSNTADDAFFFRNMANRGNQSTDEQGNWYFYNQTMVSLGKMEFEKRWGRRALGDDWRRENKKTMNQEESDLSMMPSDPFGTEDEPGSPEESEGQEPRGSGIPDKQSLMEGLPLTPEKMAASRERVEEAMFRAAMVFYEQLEKYGESREMLEKLLFEFPETAYLEKVLMIGYLSCQHLNDVSCMARRKMEYLSGFPDTRFADYLKDPEYVEKQQILKEEMNKIYSEAYNAYKDGAWLKAIGQLQLITNSRFESLKPKALLLMAMANGRSGKVKLFESGLTEVVALFEGSPEAALAKEWLAMIGEGRRPVKIESENGEEKVLVQGTDDVADSEPETAPEGFVLEPDSAHYMLMVVNNEANLNQLMFNVADYNFERFLVGDYQLKTEKMSDGRRVLKVGPFSGKNIGMDYYYSLRENQSILKGTQAGGSTLLLVSANNLKLLLLSGEVGAYQTFFLEQYLPGSETSAIVISEREVEAQEIEEESEKESGEETVSFSREGGQIMGMVILPSESGNKKRAIQFLPNYVRNVTSVMISVTEEQLTGGTTVLLLKSFEAISGFNKLKEALAGNSYWNSKLAGDDWLLLPVTNENFKLVREQGSVDKYMKFLENRKE